MDKYIQIIENDETVKKIIPYLKGVKAYITGGYIRDIMMNETSPDKDLIICEKDIKEFSKKLAENLNAHFIELDDENKIYRIILEDKINYMDITSPVKNDFETDIKRRDLTMNAIAYDINGRKIIDLTGGIEDIKNKIIKGISDKNFSDDPLRLLRIFRFCAKTGFEIDEHLIKLAEELKTEINKPSKERITAELLKMFEGGYTCMALKKLDESGLLEEIFPIYKEVKKIPPNTHHHLDLFSHLTETVKQIQAIYEDSKPEIKKYLDNGRYGGVKEIGMLKLAGFLHDIGKPFCWTINNETGRHRFIKHDIIGAEKIVPLLKNLKFSKKQIEYIKTLIKYHIYPSGLVSSNDGAEKAFLKFYRKMDGYVIDVIILAMADRLSARGVLVTEDMVKTNISNLKKLMENYIKEKENIKPVEKLLDGRDIMEILNIKQGPELGRIINALKEAQISSEVATKQEAVDYIINISTSNKI